MKLSHSKLQTILSCPMTYYLIYKAGIKPKVEKSAFSIGTAVHWGIEHDTEDLSEYYKENGDAFQIASYTADQMLAEAMIHGYLLKKDDIINNILIDTETGEQLKILNEKEIENIWKIKYEDMINICKAGKEIDSNLEEITYVENRIAGEIHELSLIAPLKSYKYKEDHEFVGIIDLLLVTNKGFVLIDYKTSSQKPDWEKYLDQIYRYIYLLNFNFPNIPVIKTGIINLRKSQIRQKQNENKNSFLKRLITEYELDDDNNIKLIDTHIFDSNNLDNNLIKAYIDNLSIMADTAQTIDENDLYFINYTNANGVYGKSSYYDIFYNVKDAYLEYNIKDTIFDENEDKIMAVRDCVPLDMLSIMAPNKILNNYNKFKNEAIDIFSNKDINSKDDLFKELNSKYITDDSLLDKYWKTLEKE